MLDANGNTEIEVGFHLGLQLALRIDHQRQRDLVRGSELLGLLAQIVGIVDVWRLLAGISLVAEAVVAEFVADLLRFGVEVARQNRRLLRPVVLGQRKIVADQRDLVSLLRLFQQRRGIGAIGALQIFKDHDRHFRPRRRTQRVRLLLRCRQRGERQRYEQR